MQTLIFDIDGTLTSLWPLERAVLLALCPSATLISLDTLYQTKTKDLYALYKRSSPSPCRKTVFRKMYDTTCHNLWKEGKLPSLSAYPAAVFVKKMYQKYQFLYATGGGQIETEYVLEVLGVKPYFNLRDSVSRTTCRYKKSTGIPFKKIAKLYPDAVLVTDSYDDTVGAKKAGLKSILI